MTSGGTEVIEMPASTSSFTTGATLDVVVVGGSVLVEVVGMVVVATVRSAAVDEIDGAAVTGGLDDVGATAGLVARGLHAAARSTTATRNDFDLTCLPPPREHRTAHLAETTFTDWLSRRGCC
jgi:hypothetical protein